MDRISPVDCLPDVREPVAQPRHDRRVCRLAETLHPQHRVASGPETLGASARDLLWGPARCEEDTTCHCVQG